MYIYKLFNNKCALADNANLQYLNVNIWWPNIKRHLSIINWNLQLKLPVINGYHNSPLSALLTISNNLFQLPFILSQL